MASKLSKKQEEIAEIVRSKLRSENGYKTDGDYVKKPICINYGLAFFHDDDYPLSICVHHYNGLQFSPHQRNKIFEVFGREEFTASYSEAREGSTGGNGEAEIIVTLKTEVFEGSNEDIADWIVKLFNHFETTMNLLLVS